MEKQFCPFCHGEMALEHALIYADYFCNKSDHFFCNRFVYLKDVDGNFVKDENGKYVTMLTRIKLSLVDEHGVKNYLKVNFDEGNCQVWTKNSKTPRQTVDAVFVPDYSDRKALLRKIKTYILFS